MSNDAQTWPDLAIGLYDKLTGRGAEITYEMEDLEVQVPSRTGSGATKTSWTVNGTIRVRTRDEK
jgi:hypothetical protein